MSVLSRREFLANTAALAVASGMPAHAAMGPNDKFDLVVKGGDVLDPSQNLRGKRDIGIRYGLVEALEADIPAARAERLLDVSGKLVTPGLIDLHSHVFPYGPAIGIPADELVDGDRELLGLHGRADVLHLVPEPHSAILTRYALVLSGTYRVRLLRQSSSAQATAICPATKTPQRRKAILIA